MSSLLLKLDSLGSIRGTIYAHDRQIFSTNDFINRVCNKEVNDVYGKTTFQRIKENPEFKDEVDTLCIYYKFPGRGQKPTPCMTIRGLQRLLMILGGKVAAEFREIVEGTFSRVMAGDQSLIEVINANAASDAPIHSAYRSAIVAEPVVPVLDDLCLKRKRDMEAKRENLKLIDYEEDVRSKRIHNIDSFMNMMTRIRPDWMQADSRLRLHTEDMIKNVYSVPAVLPAGPGNTSHSATLTISQLASELGCQKLTHGDLCKIGALAAKRWRETHPNMNIPAHPQWVDGAERMVKSYTVEDRNLLTQVFYDLGYASRA